MNINRHNYEEYFILYMDNELSSDDRRMVETFVQQHPDLKEELDILLQYKLTPDSSVLFNGKEELLKVNGDTPITLSNYEEWLVLYNDNELSPAQRSSVEQFIDANPAVKGEFALLMKARLQPEEIVFGDKESLYRKEEKVRPMPVRWWRLAAAAVLILAIGITAVLVFNKRSLEKKTDIANTHNTNQKEVSPNKIANQKNGNDNIIVPRESVAPVNEAVVDNNRIKQSFTPSEKQHDKNVVVKNNKPVISDKLPANISAPVKKQDEVIADNNNKPSNNLPQPLNNPNINKSDATNPVIADANIPKEIAQPSNNDAVTKVIPASYNNSEQLEEGGKNKKNRGIFRKLARTFEKRTNISATDGDRLLVGGLAIKLN